VFQKLFSRHQGAEAGHESEQVPEGDERKGGQVMQEDKSRNGFIDIFLFPFHIVTCPEFRVTK
jgi:hypothetical protein